MKTFYVSVLTLCLFTGLLLNTWAQTPEGVVYQAEARDNKGNLLVNEPLDVKIMILKGHYDGETVWEEQHHVMTNNYGMFVLIIGTGTQSGGDRFEAVSWGEDAHFLNVQVKTQQLQGWINMGTTQFFSVPYALHSKTASSLLPEPESFLKSAKPGVPSNVWSLFGNLNSDPSKDVLGTTDANDLILVTDNLERMRITSEGDVKFAKSIEVGEDLTVKQNVFLNTETGATYNYGPFTVENMSPSHLTGTLTVDEPAELKQHVNLNTEGGETVNYGPFTVENESPSHLTGMLTVDGPTELKNSLHVHGDGQFDADLNVDQDLTVGKKTLMNGQVTINTIPSLTGGEGNYDAYPLRVEGSSQGIAVKANAGTPGNSNNFVTFFDQSNGVRGRIEGETTVELLTNPEYIVDNAFHAANIVITTVELGIAIAEEVQAVEALVAAGASVNACTGGGAGLGAVVVEVVCPPIASLIAEATTELILKTANVVAVGLNEASAIAEAAAYNAFKHTQIGVTYQSGAGDYAEWLLKENPEDEFFPGEVVGVKAGLISHNTEGAENIMVVSGKPIVLGCAPEEGEESNYEKIAFMGQVPVKVYGMVNKGDYILPSDNNDGFGIAVSPENLKPEDFLKIVGMAWSESNTTQLNYINVAVGLNANDVTKLVITQEEKIEAQNHEISELKTRLDEMEVVLAKLDCDYEDRLEKRYAPSNVAGTATDNQQDEHARKIVYHRVTKDQLMEGITLAEKKLRAKGVDVDKHPFFMKLKSEDDYQDNYLNKILNSIEKELQAKAKIDRENGVDVTIK